MIAVMANPAVDEHWLILSKIVDSAIVSSHAT